MARTDNFNRPDEDPLSGGGNWASFFGTWGQCRVVSNQVTGRTTNANNASIYTSVSWTNDQSSALATAASSTGKGVGLIVRGGSGNGYAVLATINPPSFSRSIVRLDAGVSTTLATDTNSFSTNFSFKLDATGTTLTFTFNGSTLLTAVDATYSSGSPGIFMGYDQTLTTGDDWTGTGDIIPEWSLRPPDVQIVQMPRGHYTVEIIGY